MSRRASWITAGVAILAGGVLAWLMWLMEPQTRPGPAQAAGSGVPQRIIAMAPNIAETVFALGAGDRVVAVSSHTTYPPEARARPTVGALHDANLERIAALEPDLVIIQQKHDTVEELCRRRAIPVLKVQMTRLESIFQAIHVLGERLGCRERAAALCARIRKDLDAVEARVKGRPRPKVFLCLGRTPGSMKGLFTVGKGSFLSEMIRLAGGRDIFGDLTEEYPQISTESLVGRAPDIIIETYPGRSLSDHRARGLRADWQAMPTIPAVRNNRIRFVTDDYILVPGPRVARIAERFAGLLHPDTAP